MAYDLAKVTANGNNLIAQILANKSSLSVDKIEISDTQLPSTTDISTMTSVPKVVQTVSANGFSKNSNTFIISTVVDNSSISADYKAWVFGIWGSDSQNGQSQLIAVITSTNSPDTIPAFSGSTPVSYTYKFNIGFSNASQIQFNMIDDSFATNDTVVHTTGDETIGGQKKFDMDPTDTSGNAYAKAVDVNQQLDKKVTDNGDGSIVVNGKTFVPADDSQVVHAADLPSLIPATTADTTKDANFTAKLQKSGVDVATVTDVSSATTGLAKESDISGFYHQNTDDSSAKSAAESATTAGIYLFTGGMYYADGNGNATSVFSLALPSGTSVFNDTNFAIANADANHQFSSYNGANNGTITGNFYQPSINLLYGVDYLNNGIKITFSKYLISVGSDGYTTNNSYSVSLDPIILSKDSPNATVHFESCTEAFNLSGNTVSVTKYVYGDSSNRLVPIITSITAY